MKGLTVVVSLIIRVVIFDLGGVLLRTDNVQPRSGLAQRLGKTWAELDEIIFCNPVAQQAERGQASAAAVWVEAARLLHLPETEIPVLREQFFAGDQVDFGLIHLIERLRSRYTTALLSNSWYPDLERHLRDDLGIQDTFDVVISSAKVGRVKPNPDSFTLALEMVNAKPEETIFVDDNVHNIRAAAELGIHAIHFTGSQQLRRDLQKWIDIPGEGNDG
jgi:HAD superfamily hydrolase (TIGR01509 family)